MKIKINGYEVNITAKYEHGNKRCNKEDTFAILNYISMLANESYYSYKKRGNNGLANWSKEVRDDIYDQLTEMGYYND